MRLVSTGVAAPTVSGRLPEVAPVATFCTATVKLPLPRVSGAAREAEFFVVRVAFAIVQGVQAGPVMTIVALAGSKFVPARVRANCCVPMGGFGVVERLVRTGVAAVTVSGRVPEIAPVATF